MGGPKVLLLDEPSEGLAPLIVEELRLQIVELKRNGLPILLCEQNSGFILNISDRAYILEKGHVRWKGDVTELNRTPEIMKRFLGI
jgi:branched-chain amino acid transport system ATP-binding protein